MGRKARTVNFLSKLDKRVDEVNSLVCVGLDPVVAKMTDRFQQAREPLLEFGKYIVGETREHVSAYKPNSAFFEAHGSEGISQLKGLVEYIRGVDAGIPIILDAKRGDIGSTNDGYAEYAFDYLKVDAMTVQPYLGKEALCPILERKDKGIVVLCRTSNSGAGEFQDLVVSSKQSVASEKKVWEVVAEKVVTNWNVNGNCVLVVGATYPEELKKVREIAGEMTFLVPGIGAQGGEVEAVMKVGMNSQKKGMIINSSRVIIFSKDPAKEAMKLRDEINKYR